MKDSDKKKVEENKLFEIPEKGSLGLLALGAVGLDAWREVRDRKKNRTKQIKKGDKNNG